MYEGGNTTANHQSLLKVDDLVWGSSSQSDFQPFPEWAAFLFELGCWLKGLGDTGGRLFCVVLMPSRILASSLVALGTLIHSLSDPTDGIPWDTFIQCESGTHVYFLWDLPEGKRQLEGKIGEVMQRGNESLRQIHVESRRNAHQNLAIFLGASRYKQANVSFHPQHRTTLLNDLNNLSTAFMQLLISFNKNRLLLSGEECMIITNRAAWEREVDDLFISNSLSSNCNYSLSNLLMLKHGRIKLCSPRNREIVSYDGELSIFDGIDALRSKDSVKTFNSLILLDKSEYQEEAVDIIYGLSDYCERNESMEEIKPPFSCPEGIEMQLYWFPRRVG